MFWSAAVMSSISAGIAVASTGAEAAWFTMQAVFLGLAAIQKSVEALDSKTQITPNRAS